MLSLFNNAIAIMTAGGRTIQNLSASGHTVANQLAVWQASSQRGDATIDCAVIHCGINNVRTAVSISQTQADMTALRADMRANNPNMKVVLSNMLPARNNQDVRPRFFSQWIPLVNFWNASKDFDNVMTSAQADADDGTGGLTTGAPWNGETDGLHPGVVGNRRHACFMRWGIEDALGLLSCNDIDHATRAAIGGWRDTLGSATNNNTSATPSHKCNVCP